MTVRTHPSGRLTVLDTTGRLVGWTARQGDHWIAAWRAPRAVAVSTADTSTAELAARVLRRALQIGV
jgi:hypothetical protein